MGKPRKIKIERKSKKNEIPKSANKNEIGDMIKVNVRKSMNKVINKIIENLIHVLFIGLCTFLAVCYDPRFYKLSGLAISTLIHSKLPTLLKAVTLVPLVFANVYNMIFRSGGILDLVDTFNSQSTYVITAFSALNMLYQGFVTLASGALGVGIWKLIGLIWKGGKFIMKKISGPKDMRKPNKNDGSDSEDDSDDPYSKFGRKGNENEWEGEDGVQYKYVPNVEEEKELIRMFEDGAEVVYELPKRKTRAKKQVNYVEPTEDSIEDISDDGELPDDKKTRYTKDEFDNSDDEESIDENSYIREVDTDEDSIISKETEYKYQSSDEESIVEMFTNLEEELYELINSGTSIINNSGNPTLKDYKEFQKAEKHFTDSFNVLIPTLDKFESQLKYAFEALCVDKETEYIIKNSPLFTTNTKLKKGSLDPDTYKILKTMQKIHVSGNKLSAIEKYCDCILESFVNLQVKCKSEMVETLHAINKQTKPLGSHLKITKELKYKRITPIVFLDALDKYSKKIEKHIDLEHKLLKIKNKNGTSVVPIEQVKISKNSPSYLKFTNSLAYVLGQIAGGVLTGAIAYNVLGTSAAAAQEATPLVLKVAKDSVSGYNYYELPSILSLLSFASMYTKQNSLSKSLKPIAIGAAILKTSRM